jgi:phasin
MNTQRPQTAGEKTRDQDRKKTVRLEASGLDTSVPKAVRSAAEKTVAQTREVYERSKTTLEAVVETWEKSFGAAGQGAVALNRKFIELAQRNMNSGFELASSLAGAKTLTEIVELNTAYWQKQVGALAAQAEEMRTLSTKVTVDAAAPLKAHVTRSLDALHRAG